MKHKRIIASVVATAMMVPMMAMPVMAANSEIAINASNFPDAAFRQYISEHFDTDENGKLSEEEISAADDIYISADPMKPVVRSLQGIKYFTELRSLNCNYLELTELDISHNTQLNTLYCKGNKLTELDVSNNTLIYDLDCSDNQLTSLDISNNTALSMLWCFDNQLTDLNIENNVNLTAVYCSKNNLTELNVSKNTFLDILSCGSNQLTTIDLSNNPELTELYIYKNQLSALDLSSNPNLTTVICYDNQIADLDVSNCSIISDLECNDNKLSELDVSHMTDLTTLYCENNNLGSIDVSNNTDLHFFFCSNNNLESIDISNNNGLYFFSCSLNDIKTLDVSNLTELYRLYCFGCGLDTLDVTNNPLLELLSCFSNNLTSLDLSHNENLVSLYCFDNTIAELDVSGNPELKCISIDSNLSDIDITNCEYILDAVEGGVAEGHDNVIADWIGITLIPDLEYELTTYSNREFINLGEDDEEYYPLENYCLLVLVDVNEEEIASGVEGFAERLYTCALDRDFDGAGKDYWADALRHGTTGADAAYGFLFSDEVVNADLSDEVFVNRLYATLMDREPAAAETEYWTGAIADGTMTRSDVFAGFINSEEWANVCVTYGILSGGTGVPSITVEPSQAILDFATRLYTTCLNREADSAGLEWWAGELANLRTTGSAAAQSYFFSDEFVNAGVDDREFVNRLYLTFMNRDAADGEFDYWLGEMGNGMTRETVFGGFAGSEEFGNICAEYGIIR